MTGSTHWKELLEKVEAGTGVALGQLASKEPAHHPGGDVRNAVGSVALDKVEGYRLRHRMHLGWPSCCWKEMKSTQGRI